MGTEKRDEKREKKRDSPCFKSGTVPLFLPLFGFLLLTRCCHYSEALA